MEKNMTTPIQIATITLSSTAAEVVRDMIQQRELDDTYALRVYIAGRSCSGYQYGMALDNKPSKADSTFESQGLKILVDEISMQYMSGVSIDYIDDARGKGFLVENPNEVPACNCEGGSCNC
jgi:iron-sulfur cluster insertion protein